MLEKKAKSRNFYLTQQKEVAAYFKTTKEEKEALNFKAKQ